VRGTDESGSTLLMTQGNPAVPPPPGGPGVSGTEEEPKGAGSGDAGAERWPREAGTGPVPTLLAPASAETPAPAPETPAEGEESGTTGRDGKRVWKSCGSSSNSAKSATLRLGGETPRASGAVTDRVSAPSPEPASSRPGRLADATSRGDATRQDTHPGYGLSDDSGLRPRASSSRAATTTASPGSSDVSPELPGRKGLEETSADGGEEDTEAGGDENKAKFGLPPLQARAICARAAAGSVLERMVPSRLRLTAVVASGYLAVAVAVAVTVARTSSGGGGTSAQEGKGC